MKRLIYFLIIALSFLPPMQAKFYVPDFEDQFNKYIRRHRLAVVHFNPFAPDQEDIPELDRMKMAFHSLSNSARYKDADVAFIGVNLHNIPTLASVYGIELPLIEETAKPAPTKDYSQKKVDAPEHKEDLSLHDDQEEQEENGKKEDQKKPAVKKDFLAEHHIPKDKQATLMIFKDGKPYKPKNSVAQIHGFLTKSQIREFIEDYIGEFIDRLLEEHREELREQQVQAKQRMQQQQAAQQQQVVYEVPQYKYVYYPERTYYRPYYGGYYGGWGRRRWGGWGPGFGVGLGFGGRRGGFGFGIGW